MRAYTAGAGVFGVSKIQIQKQITTTRKKRAISRRCIWYFKDTNSKANHNNDVPDDITWSDVFGISKIQIQK